MTFDRSVLSGARCPFTCNIYGIDTTVVFFFFIISRPDASKTLFLAPSHAGSQLSKSSLSVKAPYLCLYLLWGHLDIYMWGRKSVYGKNKNAPFNTHI